MDRWWTNLAFSDGGATDWFLRSVFRDAADSSRTMYSLHHSCVLPGVDLHECLIGFGLKLLIHTKNPYAFDDGEEARGVELTYVSPESVVVANHGASGEVGLSVASLDRDFFEALSKLLVERGTQRPTRGQVFVITKTMGGYDLIELGKIATPLERDNYTQEVLRHYDHVKQDLESKAPCGRLILIDGDPGTGKSFLIKGLASEVNARFVFVPSHLVGSLSSPELIQVILAPGRRQIPTVLLLEDADASLIPRGTDNLDKLSDVLNTGDGILGELADLRVIATTNANQLELDRALLRPGRLCSYIHLERLSIDHTQRVYCRLTGREGARDGMTLAEVYRAAQGAFAARKTIERNRAGF